MADITVDEDTPIDDVDVTVDDVDNAISGLVFEIGSSDQSVIAREGITVQKDGETYTLEFVQVPNANGETTIMMKVSDGVAYAEETFQISITPVNDVPVAIELNKTLDEDTEIVMNPAENQIDPDIIDEWTVAIVAQPEHGAASVDENGFLVYTPDHNYYGEDLFTYQVTDRAGESSTKAVHLTVNPVHDPTGIENLPASVTTEKNTSKPSHLIFPTRIMT